MKVKKRKLITEEKTKKVWRVIGMPGLTILENKPDTTDFNDEQILRTYPDGGVIITIVGRSNGLGPILASHTVWPVISVPSDWREKPQNIWSHLNVPSLVARIM